MRESQTRKIPYTLVIGDKEMNDKLISYRLHGNKNTVSLKLDEFLTIINNEIENYK